LSSWAQRRILALSTGRPRILRCAQD